MVTVNQITPIPISSLPAAQTLTGDEPLPIVQATQTRQVPISQLPQGMTAGVIVYGDSGGAPFPNFRTLTAGDNVTITDAGEQGSLTISASDALGTVAWGDITGTLSDQTDLQSALDAKLNVASNLSDVLNSNESLNNILPNQSGHAGEILTTDGTNTSWAPGDGGIVGPVSSTNNAIVKWNGTDATTVANSGVLIDGSNNISGAVNIGMTGSLGTTGARVVKGWFTDLETTNPMVGSITGNAVTATVANEGTDISCFPLFVTAATGNLGPKSNAALTYNSNTGALGSTSFVGVFTGNASTATALATPRAIYGNNFDGTAALTGNATFVSGGTGSIGIINRNFAAQTANNFEAQNGTGTTYFAIGPDVLAGDSLTKNYLNITATGPTTLSAGFLPVSFNITTAGSSAQNTILQQNSLLAGYTGTSLTNAASFANAVAGAGATYTGSTASSSYNPSTANFGSTSQAQASTAGINVGARNRASQSSVANYGSWNAASGTGNTPALNVGVVGIALNGTTNTAGYFALLDGNTAAPTFSNAALIADNGATTGAIFIARDNGIATYTIADGGVGTFTGQHYFPTTTLTSTANSIAWNLNSNQVATHTATENTTLANPTNMANGAVYIFKFVQDATPRTLAFGNAYKWPGGVAPTVSTGSGAVDIFTFISNGSLMYGTVQQNFS